MMSRYRQHSTYTINNNNVSNKQSMGNASSTFSTGWHSERKLHQNSAGKCHNNQLNLSKIATDTKRTFTWKSNLDMPHSKVILPNIQENSNYRDDTRLTSVNYYDSPGEGGNCGTTIQSQFSSPNTRIKPEINVEDESLRITSDLPGKMDEFNLIKKPSRFLITKKINKLDKDIETGEVDPVVACEDKMEKLKRLLSKCPNSKNSSGLCKNIKNEENVEYPDDCNSIIEICDKLKAMDLNDDSSNVTRCDDIALPSDTKELISKLNIEDKDIIKLDLIDTTPPLNSVTDICNEEIVTIESKPVVFTADECIADRINHTKSPIYFCPNTVKLFYKHNKRPRKKSANSVASKLSRYASFITKFACKPEAVKEAPSVESIDSADFDEHNGMFVTQSSCDASDDEFQIVFTDNVEELSSPDCIRPKKSSECESEDSFVICFESDCEPGDCYTRVTDDETVAENKPLKGCLKKPRSRGSSPKYSAQKKEVSFDTSPPKIHELIEWSYEYRQARIGNWQKYSRDAEQFKQRIMELSVSLDWVLKREHRSRVYFQRFRPILMRQLREEREAKAREALQIKENETRESEHVKTLQIETDAVNKTESSSEDKDINVITEDKNLILCTMSNSNSSSNSELITVS